MNAHDQPMSAQWHASGFCLQMHANNNSAKHHAINSLSAEHNEFITSKRDLTLETKEHCVLCFGQAMQTYDVARIRLTLTRKLRQQATVLTNTTGMKAPAIIKVSSNEAENPLLTLKINLTQSYVKLSKDGDHELRLHWVWIDTLDWAGAEHLKNVIQEHYENVKSTLMGNLPWARQVELWAWLVQGFPGTLNWIAADRPPFNTAAIKPPTPQADGNYFMVTLNPRAFPEVATGIAPTDLQYFISLFVPHESWTYVDSTLPDPEAFVAIFQSNYP